MSQGLSTETYSIANLSCRVTERSIICDTGLIVARFVADDEWNPQATEVFDSAPFDFVLPISVLVESYHFCKGEPKEMFNWLFSPGAVELLPEDTKLTESARELNLWSKHDLDLVDCLLLVYSKAVSTALGLAQYLPIVTIDERMIWRAKNYDDKFRFISVKDLELGGAKWSPI